jgi:ATP-dependent Clp protease adaptor protein ClpS
MTVAMPEAPVRPANPDLDSILEEILEPDNLWTVILWNDDVNTFQHVIEVLMAVLGIDAKRALKHAVAVHTTGKSAVAVRPKDEAQLIVEQILSEKIQASMERA